MDKLKQEICSIRIMFPAESDEQAIEYKKKLSALLAEIPDAHIDFNLMERNTKVPTPPN